MTTTNKYIDFGQLTLNNDLEIIRSMNNYKVTPDMIIANNLMLDYACSRVKKTTHDTLTDDKLSHTIGNLFEPQFSLEAQTDFRHLLAKNNDYHYQCFSCRPLLRRRKLVSLDYYDNLDKFQLTIDNDYQATPSFNTKHNHNLYQPSFKEFDIVRETLDMHYELYLPYIPNDIDFSKHYVSRFKISAHSCSSTSLNLRLHIVYSTLKSFYADNRLNGGKTNILHLEEFTSTSGSPERRTPIRENFTRIPFIAQVGLPGIFSSDYMERAVSSGETISDTIKFFVETFTSQTNDIKTSGLETLQTLNKLVSTIDSGELKKYADRCNSEILAKMDPENISSAIFKNASIVAVIVAGTYAAAQRTTNSYYAFGSAIVVGLYFNRDIVMSILTTWVLKNSNPINVQMEPMYAQSGLLDDDFFTGALTILSSVIFVNTPMTKIPKELLMSIGSFDRAKSSLKDIFGFFIRAMDKLLEWSKTGIEMPQWAKYVSLEQEDLKQFMKDCDQIVVEIKDNLFPTNNYNWERLLSLQRTGRSISLNLKKSTPSIVQLLNQQNLFINKMVKQFQDSNFTSDGMRQQPFFLLMGGLPGTGKTQTMEWLARGWAKAVLPEELQAAFAEKPNDFIYPRNTEAKFWECYNSLKVVTTHDDVMQVKDIAGNPDSEAMNLIRLVDETAYALNMGTLEDKGNTFFVSQFVIATTNNMQLKAESIHDINALKRRVHLAVVCQPKSWCAIDYVTETGGTYKRLDLNKLPRESYTGDDANTATFIDPRELFEYAEYNVFNGQFTGRVFDYAELFEYGLNMRNTFRNRFYLKSQKLKEYCDHIVPIYMKYTTFESDSEYDTDLEDIPVGEPTMIFYRRRDNLDELDEELDNASNLFQVSANDRVDAMVAAWNFAPMRFNLNNFIVTHTDAEFLEFVPDRNDLIGIRRQFEANINYIKQQIVLLSPDQAGIDDESLMFKLYRLAPKTFKRMRTNLPLTYLKRLAEATMLDRMLMTLPMEYDSKWSDAFMTKLAEANNFIYTKTGLSFYRFYKDYITPLKFIIETILKILGTAFLGGAAGYAVGSVIDYGCGTGRFAQKTNNYNQSLEQKNLTRTRAHRFLQKHGNTRNVAQMASGRDKNGYDLIHKYIYKNCYEMFMFYGDKERSLGFVTFLKERLAIMPYHFIALMAAMAESGELNDNDIVLFRLNRPYVKGASIQELTFSFTVAEIVSFVRVSDFGMDSDLVLLDFPKSVRTHSDITKLIPPASEINKMRDLNVCLTVPKHRNKQDCMGIARAYNNYPCKLSADAEDIYTIRTGYKYDIRTEHGDCGAWLTLQDPTFPYKLIGFHSAGDNSSNGFATAICFEDIIQMITDSRSPGGIGVDQLLIHHIPDIAEDEPEPVMLSQGQFIEMMHIQKIPHNGGKTDIIPSDLHDSYSKALTKPAVLFPVKRGDKLIDPMELALKKYCLPHIYIRKEIDLAADLYWNTLINYKFHVDKRLFTFEEAILGVEGEEGFKSLTRKTSCGYPFNVEGYKKKFTHFGEAEEYDLNTPAALELRIMVDEMIRNAIIGYRTQSIFHDNLKDERRTIEKVEACKTRMFSSSPLPLTTVNRMYFGAFLLWFYKNRIQNGSAIGVNPYSPEWHEIALNLLHNGSKNDDCIGAGDFSRFDGSQKSRIHWLILDIINKWYNDGPINAKIRETLWLDLTNSYHLNGHTLVMWPDSLPSGHTMTLIVNTMYNNIAFRYCWIRAIEHNSEIKNIDFDRLVYLIAMGDDNLFSVSPIARSIFNEVTISTYMLELGLTYTNETKTHSTELLRKVGDVEFLKRKFRFSSEIGRYIAPLQLEVVLEVPMWTKRQEPRGIMLTNVDYSIKELSLHGKDIFDKYVPQITDQLRWRCGLAPKNVSYILNLEEALNSFAPY